MRNALALPVIDTPILRPGQQHDKGLAFKQANMQLSWRSSGLYC